MSGSNYRVQPGCHNCRHAFVKYEYDDSNEYFCTLGAPERPICGSVAMDENFSSKRPYGDITGVPDNDRCTDMDPFSIAMGEWEKWSGTRLVFHSGVCDSYEAAPPAPPEENTEALGWEKDTP